MEKSKEVEKAWEAQGKVQKLQHEKEQAEQTVRSLTAIAQGWIVETEKMKAELIHLSTQVEMLSQENVLLKNQQGEEEDVF